MCERSPAIALVPVCLGSQIERQTPAVAEFGTQIRFHSQESIADGSHAAPTAPWPFGLVQKPWNAPFASKSSQEQTVPVAQEGLYGLQIGLQTGPSAPPSSMHNRPELQVKSGPQIWPLPPVRVQVWADGSQPIPFLQSPSAAHWTQVPLVQTGVDGGHCPLPVHPVDGTHELLESHTWPLGQSGEPTHCTHIGNGLMRQTGVAGGQSWALAQTGLQASLAHLSPCGHCASWVHWTHAPDVVSQCGAWVRCVQSPSDVHRFETQVFCGEHVSPGWQVVPSTHWTHAPFLHAGVGGLHAAHGSAARQV